jgi:hypothetical protein
LGACVMRRRAASAELAGTEVGTSPRSSSSASALVCFLGTQLAALVLLCVVLTFWGFFLHLNPAALRRGPSCVGGVSVCWVSLPFPCCDFPHPPASCVSLHGFSPFEFLLLMALAPKVLPSHGISFQCCFAFSYYRRCSFVHPLGCLFLLCSFF